MALPELWGDLKGTFTPFAIRSGQTCLTSHCLVFFILRILDRNPATSGPWSRRAGFTAHQIVTFPVLAYLTGERERERVAADPSRD
jgi:hypothetical protein